MDKETRGQKETESLKLWIMRRQILLFLIRNFPTVSIIHLCDNIKNYLKVVLSTKVTAPFIGPTRNLSIAQKGP